MKDWNSNETQYAYNGDGGLTSITYPNGIVATATYDDADQLASITDADGGTTLTSFSYSRNDDGNITSETDTGTPGAGTKTSTYDSISELTATGSSSYSYSASNNLTTSPAGSPQVFNADDEVCDWRACRGDRRCIGCARCTRDRE